MRRLLTKVEEKKKMSKKLYEESNIQDIADAIRVKNGTQNQYTVAQMGNAVRAIMTQPNLETLNVTENGNYLPSTGKDGFSSVSVSVSGAASVIQPLSATQNGTYNPPSGVDGYAPVTVNVSGGGIGENVLLTRASGISEIRGKCVAYEGVCRANLRIATNDSTNKIFLIPDGYKPKIPTLFSYGYGGQAARFLCGVVLTNGDAQMFQNLASNSYRHLSCEWMFAGNVYPVTAASGVVSSIEGGVLVRNNVAFLSAYVKMSEGSNNWQDIITIPSEVKPTTEITPTIYTCTSTPYIRDSRYDVSTGIISAWRSNSNYDRDVLIQATWINE